MLSPLATARAEYAWRLRQACPDLEQQLQDVHGMVDVVLDSAGAEQAEALIEARARYAQSLRTERSGVDERLAELAGLCTWLFAADLAGGSPTARGRTLASAQRTLQGHRVAAKAPPRSVSDAPVSCRTG
jgi:hypothetical protein